MSPRFFFFIPRSKIYFGLTNSGEIGERIVDDICIINHEFRKSDEFQVYFNYLLVLIYLLIKVGQILKN